MIYVLMYLTAIVAANLTTAAFGPAWSIVNAFLFIGLDLTARDKLHDAWHGHGLAWKMAALVATGSALSWLLNRNAGMIAVASFVAFACAAVADTLVYALLRKRSYMQRVNGSNLAGAAVDSSKLASEISGIWWGYSGSTERKIGLCPNDRYQDYSESSYSGSSKDSLGNPSTSWGSASQRGGSGTWAIKGNYQEGIISVRYSNGNTATIQYRQCGEPGCLLFNGHKLCRSEKCN